jgi:hypothetical protein
MFRDTEINDYRDHEKSGQIALFKQQFGPPTLASSYTVTSQVAGILRSRRQLGNRRRIAGSILAGDTAGIQARE